VLARPQQHGHLLRAEGAGATLRGPETDRPGGDRPAALGHVVQERFVGAPPHPTPDHEHPRHGDSGPSVVVVEAEHSGEMAVDGGLGSPRGRRVDHDHVVGRSPKPDHERSHRIHPHPIPGEGLGPEELEPQLEARRVRPHRVRRALDGSQVGLGRAHPIAAFGRNQTPRVSCELRAGLRGGGWPKSANLAAWWWNGRGSGPAEPALCGSGVGVSRREAGGGGCRLAPRSPLR